MSRALSKGDIPMVVLAVSGPARRVYEITQRGRGDLAQRTRAWKQDAKTINALIGGKPDARTT
jgi:DNA-binding PadR family transcriptional regulator